MEGEARNVEDCWLVSDVFHVVAVWFFMRLLLVLFFLYFHVFPLLYYLKIAMVFMRV